MSQPYVFHAKTTLARSSRAEWVRSKLKIPCHESADGIIWMIEVMFVAEEGPTRCPFHLPFDAPSLGPI